MIENLLRILSADQIKKIHEKTLQAIDEIGIDVQHYDAKEMWVCWGARVNQKTGRIHVPPDIIDTALKKAPERFSCFGRNQELELKIGSGHVYGRNGGGPGQIVDMDTGQVREATIEDAANYTKLVDSLDNTHIAAPLYEQESIAEMRDLITFANMIRNTTKHINIRLLQLSSLPFFIEMAEVIAGDKRKLKEKPVMTLLESPIAPLKHPDVLIESILMCGKYGIPIEICSMPIAGATGPVTLAGSLLLANIEMVAAVAFGQLAHPGMPMIFAPRIMVMDLASGYALTGSIENALLVTAGVQLAKEAYRMPVNMHGPYTDSPLNDFQAGMENTYFTFLPALAGADILTGAGHLQGGLVVNFPELIMDDEIVGVVNRAIEGIKVDENYLGYEAVGASIDSDNLLMHPHTLKYMRSNRYRSKLVTRAPRASWEMEGSKSMRDRAIERTRKLLKDYTPEPLDKERDTEIEKIIRNVEKEINKN